MIRKLRLGLMLCRHWWAMFRGRSYWHHPQPLGRVFSPTELAGYFSDMTHKARWDGPVDSSYGIPLITNDAGQIVLFPITAFQKALGHWDLWLLSKKQDPGHLEAFQAIVAWALAGQDDRGAWPTWNLLSADMEQPYSAMSQGEGLSVLTRAWTVTGDDALLKAADKAETLMLTDLADGGVSWRSKQGLVLEEKPLSPPGTILNGWIYSLFGLHDLALIAPTEQRETILADTLATLAAWLKRFDTGAWSRYDLHGNLASPFYHAVHVAQLQALELTYGHRHAEFATFRERWQRWDNSRLHHWRAIGRKGWQKLRRPPTHFMR